MRVILALLSVVLLAGATVLIIFSWRHLRGSDDAELAGWFVLLGLGLSGAAAFLAESVLFPKLKPVADELRFVVLHHEGVDEPHFDLMLETSPGSSLATWRSSIWPIDVPTTLQQLADHRRDYLEFEGEIAGGRGWVRRVESGKYRLDSTSDGQRSIQWLGRPIGPLLMQKTGDSQWLATTLEVKELGPERV